MPVTLAEPLKVQNPQCGRLGVREGAA